jgi:predicted GTPase
LNNNIFFRTNLIMVKSNKYKRTKLPKVVRDQTWNTYIGNEKSIGDCYVCGKDISIQYYECGHIISVKDGGSDTIDNLRPVCGKCNKSVGAQNMNDFKQKYFPVSDYYNEYVDDFIIEPETQQYDRNIYDVSDFNRNQINMAIVGPISVGKSTFVNTLFIKQYSDMRIKRTTMTPQVYYETNIKETDKSISKKIMLDNREINELLYKKYENGEDLSYDDVKEIKYFVPKTKNLVNLMDDVYLTVYDMPGLNDGHVGDNLEVYHKWLSNNFYKFDIITCLFDINSGLNTSDEVKILKNMITNIRNNKNVHGIDTELIIVINKCDDMYLDDNGNLMFSDEEFDEMFEQIRNVITNKVNELYPELKYNIIRVSSEDAYVYRMYQIEPDNNLDMKYLNRFGYNELGKSRWNRMKESEKRDFVKEFMGDIEDDINERMQINGFNDFILLLSKTLDSKGQYKYLMNHINYELYQINEHSYIDDHENFDKFVKIYRKIKDIDNTIKDKWTYGQNIFHNKLDNYLEMYYNKHINNMINSITDFNIEIIENLLDNMKNYDSVFKSNYSEKIVLFMENNINDYYGNSIIKKSNTFIKSFVHFQKLISYGYNKIKELIKPLFDNDDILNNKSDDIIKYLNSLLESGIITEDEFYVKLKEIILKIYKAINNNRQIGYINNDKLPSYVYEAYQICNRMEPGDDLDEQIKFFAYKNMVKFINSDNKEYQSCVDDMIEKYVY